MGKSPRLPQASIDPILIRHKINLVRGVPYSDKVKAKGLFVERKRLQMQRLGERTHIALAINYRAIRRDLDRFRQPPGNGIGSLTITTRGCQI
jgi:hypothetical protein